MRGTVLDAEIIRMNLGEARFLRYSQSKRPAMNANNYIACKCP